MVLRLCQFRVEQVLAGSQHFKIIGGRVPHQQTGFAHRFTQGGNLSAVVVKADTGGLPAGQGIVHFLSGIQQGLLEQ